jgi:hypothetical protein
VADDDPPPVLTPVVPPGTPNTRVGTGSLRRRAARRQAIGTAASAALGGFKIFGKARSAGRYFKRTRSFLHNGGASGAFSRAATRAGRGRVYKAYWGAKMYVASYGVGWSIDNWGTRRRR